MIEIEFKSALIARRENGDLAIALFDGLPAPFEQERACVALIKCSDEAAHAMCASIANAGSTAKTGGN